MLDVQADLLKHLNTRAVVPLLPAAAAMLNPVFQIEGTTVVMVTQLMAAVPAALLKTPMMSLERSRNEITMALDFLFQGF